MKNSARRAHGPKRGRSRFPGTDSMQVMGSVRVPTRTAIGDWQPTGGELMFAFTRLTKATTTTHMTRKKEKPMRFAKKISLFAWIVLAAAVLDVHAQQMAGQEVCGGDLTSADIFSVGEVRTSMLSEVHFQELNGAEWVLMDGRPLSVRTALSPHLLEEGEYGLVIPDARGRFLRMANNGACARFQGSDNANECLANHDPEGDRLPGTYQGDTLARHEHDYSDVFYTEWPNFRPADAHEVDTPGDVGSGSTDWDQPRGGWGIDRRTKPYGQHETRPKNITVNYYIKICNCRTPNCK